MSKRILSAVEAAELLKVHERTIRRAIQRGDLAAAKQGRSFLIDKSDLERYRQLIVANGKATQAMAGVPLEPQPALAPIIGREREVADLIQMLREVETRQVTVAGIGGVGKTRLAWEVAGNLRRDFRDGVTWVPLTAVTSAQGVPAAIVHTAQIPPGDRPTEDVLLDAMRDREMLLVLDNFEHVLEARALVESLLDRAPGVIVLTTSRQPLGIQRERVFELAPLPTPSRDAPAVVDMRRSPAAVRLFVERVRRDEPGFVLDAGNADAIAEIVRRVDGLPLGLELLAPTMAGRSVNVFLAHLEQHLPLLIGGARGVPEKQQTLRNAMAWSYDLLPGSQREALLQLSVLVGAFDAQVAIELCEPVAPEDGDSPEALINSLVSANLINHHSDNRLSLLQTVRDFAADVAPPGARAGHELRMVDYFADLGSRFDLERSTSNQKWWLAFSRRHAENIREALRLAETHGRFEELLTIANGFVLHWASSGFFGEGLTWMERGLNAARNLDPVTRMRALARAGYLAKLTYDLDGAQTHLIQALELAEQQDDTRELCEILDQLSDNYQDFGDYEQAASLQKRLIAESEVHPDRSLMALGYCGLGVTRMYHGDFDAACELLEHSHGIASQSEDSRRLARIAVNWGLALRYRGNLSTAEAHYSEAEELYHDLGERTTEVAVRLNRCDLALASNDLVRCIELADVVIADCKHMGDRRRVAIALANKGIAVARLGDVAAGTRQIATAASMFLEQGAKSLVIEALNAGAAELAEAGQMQRAAAILGAASALASQLGFVGDVESEIAWRKARSCCEAALGKPEFDQIFARGAHMALDDVIRLCSLPAASNGAIDAPDSGPLSIRERDVLALLSDGLTDQQIADQLFVSKRTVSTHVASILSKLRVESRTAAASIAIRRGLV